MKLIYEAEYDFKEITFPKIRVRHLKNKLYGYYHIKNNEITLSSYLARVSLKFVKVVLYHELSHTLIITHKEEFIDIFKNKYKDGPILDEELKNICYNVSTAMWQPMVESLLWMKFKRKKRINLC